MVENAKVRSRGSIGQACRMQGESGHFQEVDTSEPSRDSPANIRMRLVVRELATLTSRSFAKAWRVHTDIRRNEGFEAKQAPRFWKNAAL